MTDLDNLCSQLGYLNIKPVNFILYGGDIIKMGYRLYYVVDFLINSKKAVVKALTENGAFVKKPNCFSEQFYLELNQPFTLIGRDIPLSSIPMVSWVY